MNAVFIRKRNQSLQWMWACLAAMDTAIWLLSRITTLRGNHLVVLLLVLTVLCAGIAALVNYALACEHYVSAKENVHSPAITGFAFVFSFFASGLVLYWAGDCGSFNIAYFAMPMIFALGALPLKLMRDRA